MVKAMAGGGGRGMRPVTDPADSPRLWSAAAPKRCNRSATAMSMSRSCFRARGTSRCRSSATAPAPSRICGSANAASSASARRSSRSRRRRSCGPPSGSGCSNAAMRLAAASKYLAGRHLRVPGRRHRASDDASIAFIEANARLQVEHTVTEEVTGVDLVSAQLEIASGATLADLKLRQQDIPAPRGIAIQARVNLETMQPDGSVRGSGGVINVYEPPSGRGVRVDGYGYSGYRTNPRFDSLLAKVIVACEPQIFADAAGQGRARALRIPHVGVPTNIPFLRALLRDPRVLARRRPHPVHRRTRGRARCRSAGCCALLRAAGGSGQSESRRQARNHRSSGHRQLWPQRRACAAGS